MDFGFEEIPIGSREDAEITEVLLLSLRPSDFSLLSLRLKKGSEIRNSSPQFEIRNPQLIQSASLLNVIEKSFIKRG